MFLKFSSRICRVCLGAEVICSLLDGSGNDERFKYVTGLELSEYDGLPTFLCQSCFDALNTAVRFKEQCIASDTHLRSFVDSVNSKFASEIGNLQSKSDDNPNEFVEETLDLPAEHEEVIESVEIANSTHSTLKIEVVETEDLSENKEETEAELIEQIEEEVVPYRKNQAENEQCEDDSIKDLPNVAEEIEPLGSNTCEKCNKTFSFRGNLIRHMLSHSEVKPFLCPICGSGFTQNGSLKQHMLRHTGTRPFSCALCEKTFTRKRILAMHTRIHTGEKPYYCEECNLSFTVKEGLRRHNLRKHMGVSNTTYVCKICGKTLHSKYTYRNHLNVHSKSTPQFTVI